MAETKGERLRIMRESRGLTLEEVAKALGVSKQTVYKYEKNIVTNIPSDKIKALADLYLTTPAEIMGWADTSSAPTHNPTERNKKKPSTAAIVAAGTTTAVSAAALGAGASVALGGFPIGIAAIFASLGGLTCSMRTLINAINAHGDSEAKEKVPVLVEDRDEKDLVLRFRSMNKKDKNTLLTLAHTLSSDK